MPRTKKDILNQAQNIAILGCSNRQYRTSHHIAVYLKQQGYNIIPVNPNYDQILGEKVYSSLQEIPDDIEIDIADIFRDRRYTADMVDQVIERTQSSGKNIAIWTQLDVSSDKAKEKADQAGLPYIENECIMVQHQRLIAEG